MVKRDLQDLAVRASSGLRRDDHDELADQIHVAPLQLYRIPEPQPAINPDREEYPHLALNRLADLGQFLNRQLPSAVGIRPLRETACPDGAILLN